MWSNVFERCEFRAHPRSRQHARGARETSPTRAHTTLQFLLDEPARGQARSPSRPDGSLDLDEERHMRSTVSQRSSFRAHPRSRPRTRGARETRPTRAHTTLQFLLDEPARGQASFALPPGRIARSRQEEANEVHCLAEIFVSRAPEVYPTKLSRTWREAASTRAKPQRPHC